MAPLECSPRRPLGALSWIINWSTYRARRNHRPPLALQKQAGRDEHSIEADAQFVDPAKGDFRVKEGSPALKIGL